ncbi:MAG TPA: hypothetical protein DIU39_00395 [Flavobacteriales bacterium]|nr:hypothetical protein [Flavobacteriales bacterium]
MEIEFENKDKIIRLPKATLRINQEGLMFVHFSANDVFDLEDCFDYEQAVIKICNHKPHPIIIDASFVKHGYMTYAARDYIARSKQLKSIRKSNAFVVNSLTTKLMAKAYVIINRPNCPAKIFNDMNKAIEWSLQFR